MKKMIEEAFQWRKIYRLGGYAAIFSFLLTLADIIYGSATSGDITLQYTAIEAFNEINQNWLIGLYHLDLLNMINTIVMLPVYYAIYGAHKRKSGPIATLSLILAIIGTTIFLANNAALPMFQLTQQYYTSPSETQRTQIAAAGEALLARGAHGGLGVFPGFLILSLAGVSMAFVMYYGDVFPRRTGLCGVIGNTLLLVYVVLVTFIPGLQSIAVAMAAPGGLLALAWMLLTGRVLIKNGSMNEVNQ